MLRLAFAGTRADRARVLVTAFGAAVAVLVLLVSATILAVTPESGRYRSRLLTNESLLLNVALAMILFAVPILFFVAQCARLGAPSRNRRLAAFRLAGASPAQVRRIAGTEAGVAAVLGTAIGALTYFAGRALLDGPGTDGKRSLPTDILPPTVMVVALVIAVPLLATLLTMLLLHRVAITPFGVLRRTRKHRVRPWPALLGIVGLAGLTTLESVSRSEFVRSGRLGSNAFPLMGAWIFVCTILLMIGLMLGTAWIGHISAKLLLRLTRHPSALIAARQTLDDPYDGSRTYTVILITTAFGAAVMMIKSWLATDVIARTAATQEWVRRYGGKEIDYSGTAVFRADMFEIIDTVVVALIGVAALTLLVALFESSVGRRRTTAALVAAGTPRGVLARALCWRSLLPTVPGIAAASVAGMLAMRSFTQTATGRGHSEECVGTADQCADPAFWAAHSIVRDVSIVVPVPLPWADAATIGAVALLCVLAVVATGVLFQRTTMNPTELRTD